MSDIVEASIEVFAMSTTKGLLLDQTSSTLSISTDGGDECKEDQVENNMLGNHLPHPSSRFVLKDDCEPPSPVRRMSTQEAADCVVVLNTRHSLLVTDTDTDGEDDDEDEACDEITNLGDSPYRTDLVNLSFRLEMEAHAKEGDNVVVSTPVLDENEPTSDRRSISLRPRHQCQDNSRQETSISSRPASILDTVAEGFVDTLCHPSTTCARGHAVSLPPGPSSPADISENSIEKDFLQVMGCSLPPDEDEIAHLWDLDMALQLTCSMPSQSTAGVAYSHPNSPRPLRPTGPHRPGPRERIRRLRQWRKERSLVGPFMPPRTYSVDYFASDRDSRAHPVDDNLMYDSDPEMSLSMRPRKKSNKTALQCSTTTQQSICTLRWTVREGMNQKWDLVWHTEKTSVPVRAWMERGTVVGQQMLEPSLVWKDSSNDCTQLRFLNICRVLQATPQDQRKASILSRPSCTVRLMTSTGAEYFLETSSVSKRDEIVSIWKACIARFATLAVLEDLDSIQNEFFHPESHSYVPDMEKTMEDLDRDERNDI
jgi:hypothetical protein